MATHVITISATTASPYPLTVSDDEGHTASTHEDDALLMTDFVGGDTVKWQIAPGCDIASIDAITVTTLYVQNNPFTLFSSGPSASDDGTGSWSGVIDDYGASWHGEVEEPYTITYTLKNGTQYTEDPRIRIKQ